MVLTFKLSKWYVYLAVSAGMGLYHTLVFHYDIVPYSQLGPIGTFFHSLAYNHYRLLSIGYLTAWIVHLGEAIYSLVLTRRANLEPLDQFLWFAQTLLLGYGSLGPLKRILSKRK